MPRFQTQRSILIDAPLSKVFQTVRNFQTWPQWSPWLIAEPDCDLTFGPDKEGYSWDGNIVGKGEINIVQEIENEKIDYHLAIHHPWKSFSDVQISFVEKDGAIEVTWKLSGRLPFYLFFVKSMMQNMIAVEYERGLKMLKSLIEIGNIPSKLDFNGTQVPPECDYVGLRTSCDLSEVGALMKRDFERLQDSLRAAGVSPAGPAFSIYEEWKVSQLRATYVVAFPISDSSVSFSAEFIRGHRDSQPSYAITHTGPYDFLGNAWAAGMSHAQAKVFSFDTKRKAFEIYETEPDADPVITTVYFPITS